MKIGIGLPATIPGIEGKRILDWAKKADSGPFSSLTILDRLVYSNYESLITLAAVAGVTQHIRLMTTVLLAPLRNPVLFAKQAASPDALSGGRLTLGLGIGAREDDYLAASVSYKRRGKLFDEQLETLKRIWSGQSFGDTIGPIGPTPVQSGGPEILIGGYSPVFIQKDVRWGKRFIPRRCAHQENLPFFPFTSATLENPCTPPRPPTR